MNTVSADLMDGLSEARRQVESCCQSLVDAGAAQWWINDDGNTGLHMHGGEAYLSRRVMRSWGDCPAVEYQPQESECLRLKSFLS